MLALAALVVLVATVSFADVDDYVGKPIASVTVESGARPVTDPRVVSLIETQVGQPLRIAVVRESVTHLYSLGEFEDVRVHAAIVGNGVAITYELVPLRTITSVSFTGDNASGIDPARLRRVITERFGRSPLPARIPEIEALVAADLKEIGYLHAGVASRSEAGGDGSSSRLTLVLALNPGERTRIGAIDVEGNPGMPLAEFLNALHVSRGAPFQRDVLNARIDRYLEQRRSRGYFAARLSFVPHLVDGDRTADLTLTVLSGPHVTIVFAGDPLPGVRVADLVPVAREGSADEDILEDASNRIEELLRSQGYRDGVAPHTSEERDGELVITFTVRKGPQYRVGRVDISGNASMPLTDLQQRLRIRPGQPFSEAALVADRAIVEDLYHAAGFAAVQTTVSTDSEPAVAGASDVPVAIRIAITENVRAVVESVRIEGNVSVSDSDLRPTLSLQVGQPFSVSAVAVDRDALQLRLANLGYQSAAVIG